MVALAVAAAAVGGLSILAVAAVAKGCSGAKRVDDLESRLSLLEGMMGIDSDAGATRTTGDVDGSAAQAVRIAVPGPGSPDHNAACALAKVAAYQAWQDALTKAKALAGPAQAECHGIMREKRKQACYYAALASVRTVQASREAVMKGGRTAREVVQNVKDEPNNELIARARLASQAAFSACQDENEL